jgi:hypothetical protein
MSMIEIGTTGSSRQSWEDFNPRPLLEKLMRDFKGDLSLRSSREQIIDDFVEQRFEGLHFDDEHQQLYVKTIIEYWAHNNYNSLLHLFKGHSDHATSEQVRLNEEMITKAKQAIKVMWYSFMMPNGKKLAECTGKDLQSMAALMDHNTKKLLGVVKPHQKVKAVFDKDQLQEFLSWDSETAPVVSPARLERFAES